MADASSNDPIVLYISREEAKVTSRLLSRLQGPEARFETREPIEDHDLRKLADWICATRRERNRAFAGHLFSDPAWDMLIALYCASERGEEISVTSLIFTAEVPQSTGLRWMRSLEAAGLIETTPDHSDKRRLLVNLSGDGRLRVERCLALSAKRIAQL